MNKKQTVLALAVVVLAAGCVSPRVVDSPAVPMVATSPPATASAAPEVAYRQHEWTALYSTSSRPPKLVMDIPVGWTERSTARYWADFTDPVSQTRLRVDVTGAFGSAPVLGARAMADRHIEQQASKKRGYRLVRDQLVPVLNSGFGDVSRELVYRYQLGNEELEATYHFTGTGGVTNLELSVHYRPLAAAAALKVLDHADRSAKWVPA